MQLLMMAIGLVSGLFLGTEVQAEQVSHNALTSAEKADGWELLFNGRALDGWRNYGQEGEVEGWRAVDGLLSRVGEGGDIITDEVFENFDLRLEWRIETGGNSGIFFRVREGAEAAWHTAPEMQVLDDAAHPDGQEAKTSAGSDYGLFGRSRDTIDGAEKWNAIRILADGGHLDYGQVTKTSDGPDEGMYGESVNLVNPVGDWNTVRILVDGSHVEYWLNGVLIVEYELWSEEWERRVQESKFGVYPEFGRARQGHFALQNHGDPVFYRNIKVRRLPSRSDSSSKP